METARFAFGFSHPARGDCPLHNHSPGLCELVYYDSGSGSVHTFPPGVTDPAAAATFPFRRGSVLIHPPLALHDQHNDEPSLDCCLQFDARALTDFPPGPLFVPRLTDPRLRQEIHALCKVKALRDPARRRICDLRLTALLWELAELIRHGEQGADDSASRLAAARRYMQDHFDLPDGVAQIAARFAFSPDYFRHLFTAAYKQAPKEYLLQLRLEHARRLLTGTPLPQKSIAELCGFGNIRYFNTRFRHYFGHPPGDLRKGHCPADANHEESA